MRGISDENLSVKRQHYKNGRKNVKASFHTYTIGMDGFSPLLNPTVISPLLGFKGEWANYRKYMTVPQPDACNSF